MTSAAKAAFWEQTYRSAKALRHPKTQTLPEAVGRRYQNGNVERLRSPQRRTNSVTNIHVSCIQLTRCLRPKRVLEAKREEKRIAKQALRRK
jgi:hypothetical protein